MFVNSQPRERVNQKRRTRTALVEAAQRVLAGGRTPTVAQVADEAAVSRATAYRYFPTQEHLLLDVVLERSIDEIDRTVHEAVERARPDDRIAGVVGAVQAEIASNERAFRSLLALSVGQARAGDGPLIAAVRGERRVGWIEDALAPLRTTLPDESFRRLASALALCVGAEAYFVLRDLCGLPDREARETLEWTARTLVTAAMRGRPKAS
jgi:AcrR family transcriptional regulator